MLQWNETALDGSYRENRGGSWADVSATLENRLKVLQVRRLLVRRLVSASPMCLSRVRPQCF